jgi:hypothetical protein
MRPENAYALVGAAPPRKRKSIGLPIFWRAMSNAFANVGRIRIKREV